METISKRLEDLLAFHLVAVEQSFTRAADSLGGSKAQVSKQVQRLEASLGTQLFHRSTRSVRLTEEGRALLEFSRKILDLSDEAGRRLRDLQSGDGGVIRMSTPVSLGDAFFPTFLTEMRRTLPRVVFDTELANEARDFKRDEIDFAIRSTEDHDPDLVARYLGKLKDVVCCSPSAARRVTGRDPRVLSEHECILSSIESDWNTWTLSSAREEVRVQVSGRVATNQYGTVRLYALAGLGVARLPYYQVMEDLHAGRLVQLFDDYRIATHSLYLVYLKGAYVSKRHKVVRDGIMKWFKDRREIFI